MAFTRWIPGLKSETPRHAPRHAGTGGAGWGTPSVTRAEPMGRWALVLIPISDHPLGATFAIRVQPRATRAAITGTVGDALKVSLSAPPLDGRANVALVEFFSEILSVPRSAVQVVAGERSRNKIVRIAGYRGAEVQRMLQEHFTV